MRDLLKPIENNIANLKFAIEFDIYDLTHDEQEGMLRRLDEIQEIVNKAKSRK